MFHDGNHHDVVLRDSPSLLEVYRGLPPSLGVKWLECEDDHSLPPSDEVKNKRCCNSTLPCACMVCIMTTLPVLFTKNKRPLLHSIWHITANIKTALICGDFCFTETFCTCCILRCLVCIVVSCLVCIVVILCVFAVLCVYCCFYFRCQTAGYKSVFGRSCDRPPWHRFFLASLCL